MISVSVALALSFNSTTRRALHPISRRVAPPRRRTHRRMFVEHVFHLDRWAFSPPEMMMSLERSLMTCPASARRDRRCETSRLRTLGSPSRSSDSPSSRCCHEHHFAGLAIAGPAAWSRIEHRHSLLQRVGHALPALSSARASRVRPSRVARRKSMLVRTPQSAHRHGSV